MSTFRYAGGDRPLDGFTIEYGLGRGGFGEVYFAKSDAGREVALKVIQNYEDIELRGIGHCMNLKSPHLVTIFDVKHDSTGRPWVVMEYVAGPCLKDLLDEADAQFVNDETSAGGSLGSRRKGIGEDQALYFMRELIKGMRYLHDSGVVHRDLKPHNIFFEDGTVKIGDYSLSKAISTSHRSGHTTTVGSVHYMAPEIGEGKYGKAVDIYALGVIFFEMLTGNPPYVGQSMGEVLIKHLTSEPEVSDLNPAFGRVITKAMARKPEDRFESVDEMLHVLCPEDHSSYLPAPASLSMIGDRATARRMKASTVQRSGLGDDTFIQTPSLIDTKEDSQSQPFERPGLAVPYSLPRWLDALGLWWQPAQGTLLDSERLPLWWRVTVAVSVCVCFAAFATVMNPLSPNGTIVLIALLSAIGFFACFSFLQCLPRENSVGWILANRVIGTAIVLGTATIACLFLPTTPMGEMCDDDNFPALFWCSVFVDWRCFISISRYPRIGILKMIIPLAIFVYVMMWWPHQPSQRETLNGLLFIAAGALSIQILAPHGRIGPPQDKGLKKKSSFKVPNQKEDPAISKTRFESDSFSLQEKV